MGVMVIVGVSTIEGVRVFEGNLVGCGEGVTVSVGAAGVVPDVWGARTVWAGAASVGAKDVLSGEQAEKIRNSEMQGRYFRSFIEFLLIR